MSQGILLSILIPPKLRSQITGHLPSKQRFQITNVFNWNSSIFDRLGVDVKKVVSYHVIKSKHSV